jgi:hypothetical protein
MASTVGMVVPVAGLQALSALTASFCRFHDCRYLQAMTILFVC